LQFKAGVGGVEELSDAQKIGQIWREPPPTGRIHIFVTPVKSTRESVTSFQPDSGRFLMLLTVLPGVATRLGVLRVANSLHYEFWGKDINDLLHVVPGSNLQYLSKAQISSLCLRDLFYPECTLLVRETYKGVYDNLKKCKSSAESTGSYGKVITGQPGIGMCDCHFHYITTLTIVT
jgi:hypothetical protein